MAIFVYNMAKKKQILYTLKDKNKMPVYQCFNYKEAKAAKVMYEEEYGKLTLHRVEHY